MGSRRFIKNVEKPKEQKVGQRQYIAFSFDLLHDVSYTDCDRPEFFIGFLKRLRNLCRLDWDEINKSQRHSFGYEKIPIALIKKDMGIAMGMDYLFAFRATGDNHVFLVFRLQGGKRIQGYIH